VPAYNQNWPGGPVFVPGQGLDRTVVACRNSIIGRLVGWTPVTQAGSVPWRLYNCINAATTASAVNGCLSTFCAGTWPAGGSPSFCRVNSTLGLIANCSEFAAYAFANFAIPNTMQALNNGLFQGCIRQASCNSCRRCCGANGASGSTNGEYSRCIRGCAALPGGLFSASWGARQRCGLPFDFNANSDFTPCLEDFAGWSSSCGR
jgi:hypothetical protein